MFAVVIADTALVLTEKVVVLVLAAMTIGVVAKPAAMLSDDGVIVTSTGAFAFKVTVAMLFEPPITEAGASVRLWINNGVIVRVAEGVAPLNDAVIVAVVCAGTTLVGTVNVPVVPFAATATLAMLPTVAAPGPLTEIGIDSADGAEALNVRVPVDAVPPRTVVGFRLTVAVIGVTVNVAVAGAAAASDAEIVAVIVDGVSCVDTWNVADVPPAVTFTVGGTVTPLAALSLDRLIVRPPTGAAELRVTVPALDVLPTTVIGFRDTETTAGGVTVKGAVFVTPFSTPEIVAVTDDETAIVVIGKVAVVAPDRTVTDAYCGAITCADLSLESVTLTPPAGAALLIVTVPVEPAAPSTVDGATVRLTRPGAVTVNGADWLLPL